MKIVVSFLLIVCCFSARAQQAGARITKTSVSLYNNADQKLSVLMGLPNQRLDTFQLPPKETWYSPSFLQNPLIKIKTKDHILTYQLKLGTKYMIFWNNRKKWWDVKKL